MTIKPTKTVWVSINNLSLLAKVKAILNQMPAYAIKIQHLDSMSNIVNLIKTTTAGSHDEPALFLLDDRCEAVEAMQQLVIELRQFDREIPIIMFGNNEVNVNTVLNSFHNLIVSSKFNLWVDGVYDNKNQNADIYNLFLKLLQESDKNWLDSHGIKLNWQRFSDRVSSPYAKDKIVSSDTKQFIKISKLTQNNYPVLIQGESGTGKELVAQVIHELSPRSNHPFITINCAAIPAPLLESELFGYQAGAFTGVSGNGKKGKFEVANRGTLFLDEIGDMELPLQAKILRVLEEGVIWPIGYEGTTGKPFDARIVAATSQNLESQVKEKMFRKDLYFRLNCCSIILRPLRDKKHDLIMLIEWILAEMRHEIPYIRVADFMPRYMFEKMTEYHWPGNVRELKNVIRRVVVLNDWDEIQFHGTTQDATEAQVLKAVENLLSGHHDAIEKTIAAVNAFRHNSDAKGSVYDNQLCLNVPDLDLERKFLRLVKNILWEKVIDRVNRNRKYVSRVLGTSLRSVDHNEIYRIAKKHTLLRQVPGYRH